MPIARESMAATRAGQPAALHLRWYACEPRQALAAMDGLTLEVRGAFRTVLELIYLRGGEVPDDHQWIARALQVDVRVWKRIRLQLLERGRLYLVDGMLREAGADRELARVQARLEAAAGRHQAASSTPSYADSYRPKSPRVSCEISDITSPHLNSLQDTPQTPAAAVAPDRSLSDQVEPEFARVVQAWPKPGKRQLALEHWQAKRQAGIAAAELEARCMARARDPVARRVLLASFLRDADFAAPAIAASAGPDPLQELRLGAIMRGEAHPAQAVDQAVATLGLDQALQVWRRQMSVNRDRVSAWQAVSVAARQAGRLPATMEAPCRTN